MFVPILKKEIMPATARPARKLAALGLVVTLGLGACGPAPLPPGDSIADRDEAQNRATHELNLVIDRALISPAAQGYGTVVPQPVRQGVSNFASNLNQPGYVLNNLLQFRLGDAVENTLRFAVNSTVGLGGLLDPATAMGLPAAETDFGETMHIYGFPEGDFAMLPFFGPSTTRDTVGTLVDFAINPVRIFVDTPESYYVTGSSVLGRFGDRYDFADTIDSVLYESADSYAQLRSLYLQTRRFELGGSTVTYVDPYLDAGTGDSADADLYTDPYSDPYTDPYAQ